MPRKPLLGYCPKCGRDVEVDFCDHCSIYVQPSQNDTHDEIAPPAQEGK